MSTTKHQAFYNRLQKNLQVRTKKAQQYKLEAFRLYDLDIPEYPYIIDQYKSQWVFFDRTDPYREKDQIYLQEILEALPMLFQLDPNRITVKRRKQQKGADQYQRVDSVNQFETVQEGKLRFLVNLQDYLDTGLFLDHRVLRGWLAEKKFQGQQVLNLFCYTGSLSVAAAKGGWQTTSVDMSKTYLNWAQENFLLNDLPLAEHLFVNADVLQFMRSPPAELYDLILIDPPTFSNSKKMEQIFEVEKDQGFLIASAAKMLNQNGKILFSNNKRGFRLSREILDNFLVQDLTESSIPFDFKGPAKPHVLFLISQR